MEQSKSCYPRDNNLDPRSIFDDDDFTNFSRSFPEEIGDISDNSANTWWRQGGIGFSGNTRYSINLEVVGKQITI